MTMDPKTLKEIQDERNMKCLQVLIIDKSGSMEGDAIDLVRQASIDFANKYYELMRHNGQPIQLIVIPFNHKANLI